MNNVSVLATFTCWLVVLSSLPAAAQSRLDARQDRPAGAPVAAAPRQALVKDCDAQASTRKLSGAARGAFMTECLAGRPAETPGTKPAADNAQNLQQKEVQDAQFRRWNSAADRAMKSICAGCSGQGASAAPRPRKAKTRPRPPPDEDDGARAGGADDLD